MAFFTNPLNSLNKEHKHNKQTRRTDYATEKCV